MLCSLAENTYAQAPKCLHRLRQSGTSPFIVFVFALCERKNKNIQLGSTMLPQAKTDYPSKHMTPSS
jgi:hypothetical protein